MAGLRASGPPYSRRSAMAHLPCAGAACALRSSRSRCRGAPKDRAPQPNRPTDGRNDTQSPQATEVCHSKSPYRRGAGSQAAGHVSCPPGEVMGRDGMGTGRQCGRHVHGPGEVFRRTQAPRNDRARGRPAQEHARDRRNDRPGSGARHQSARSQPARTGRKRQGRPAFRDHPAPGRGTGTARPGVVRDEAHALVQPGNVEGTRGPGRRSPGGARRPRARVREHLPRKRRGAASERRAVRTCTGVCLCRL